MIDLINIIDSILFNSFIWIVKTRSRYRLFGIGRVKCWSFHLCHFRCIVAIEKRLFHFFYSLEKLLFILISVKLVGWHFIIKSLFLTIIDTRKETFWAWWRIVEKGLSWVGEGFGLLEPGLAAFSLRNADRNFSLEIRCTVILVFLVVGEVAFPDTELRDSFPAIGGVILPLDFLNALISLWELGAFLHVVEVVALPVVGESFILVGIVLPGAGGVVVHLMVVGSIWDKIAKTNG